MFCYENVDLGFTFKYFGRDYTRVSISLNGYVCLGYNNYECGSTTRPFGHDILIGLNIDLNPEREGSGQIYYKNLDSNSIYFKSFNLFNLDFEPQQIFMVTYDNVLPSSSRSTSITSFQIYLSTDTVQSFVVFKFKSCPKDLIYYYSSGLNYKGIDDSLKEVIIPNGQQCSGSNVGQAGVWVSDVTSRSKLKHYSFILFPQRIDSKVYNFYLQDVTGFFNSLNSGIFGCKAFFYLF
jgi:hypothetical protein